MTGTCGCCDQPGRLVAHGWRWACYSRWTRAGKPSDGPPPARLTKAERLAEYELLVNAGENPTAAGRRLGLEHERTIRSYETERKAKGMSAVTCRCCARQRPLKARGWCTACYMRWTRAGRPADGPPAPPPPRRNTAITCVGCGQTREHVAHGWCIACYTRWYRAGQPAGGPPVPKKAAPSDCSYRISEYEHLLSCGETQERAAEQIGVSVITARKYTRRLAKEAA